MGYPRCQGEAKRFLRSNAGCAALSGRDDEGAERCVVSALQTGANAQEMADMLFAAVTDHRYIDVGHPADFTNKAFEALDMQDGKMPSRC